MRTTTRVHRGLVGLLVLGGVFSQLNAAKAPSFAVCAGLTELRRPGLSDSWDTYWLEGLTLKAMTVGHLSTVTQADNGKTVFETMHTPTVDNDGAGNPFYTLESTATKWTEEYRPPAANTWTGSIHKDPDYSTLYYFYHREVGEGGNCAPETHLGIATSTNGGSSWTDRGLYAGANIPVVCDGTWQGIGSPAVAYDNGYYYIFADNYGGGTTSNKVNQGLIVARISLTDLRGSDPSSNVYFYNGSGPGGSWNLNTVTTTGTNFLNNVYPASGYLTTSSWRNRTFSSPYNFGTPSIHWNTTLSRYVIVAEIFRGNAARTNDKPVLLVKSSGSLANDPLSWSAFAAYRASGGDIVTGASVSEVSAPDIAEEYYTNLVSPDTGTDKSGGDMRLFATPGSIGQQRSTRSIKFATGSTPPTCGSGGSYSVNVSVN
jgi:hypothetical protein